MAQKIAFITGGNRGLGFQTALDLGKNKEENIKVVIGSRDKAQGEQAVTKLRAAGVDADTIQFDITNLADYQAAYNYFDSKYGKLDILVNNAGIAGGKFPGEGPEHRAADVPMDLLRKVFETNFFAQVELTEKLLPLIKKSSDGRIVKPVQHSGLPPATRRSQVANLQRQVVRVRCLQDRSQCIHRASCI